MVNIMARNPKGYPVPDPINPGALTCLTVYVPKSAPYIGAFFAAYEFFGTWAAWARDPLHKGKQAAQVWTTAIEKTRARYELLKGECMANITAIRTNPLDGCEVQIQYDGGPDWVHAFNISDCADKTPEGAGALRWNGSTLQQYDPCTGTWRDLGPASNPAYDHSEPGQWAGDPCGHGLAAANLAKVLEDNKNRMCARVGELADFAVLVLEIVETIAAFIGLADSIVIVSWLTGVWAYLQEHYTDVAAFNLYELLSPILPSYFSPDGSITDDNFNAMLERLTSLMNGYATLTPGNTAMGYAVSWVTAAGPVGVVKANKAGDVTTFDCGSAEWRIVWDLTKERGPWIVDTSLPGLRGRWEEGTGWVAVYSEPIAGTGVRVVGVFVNIPSTHITYQGMTYTNTGGTFSNPSLQVGEIEQGTFTPESIVGPVTNNSIAVETPNDWTSLGFFVRAGFDDAHGGADPGGTGVISRIELRGTGPNPFEGS